MTYEEFLNEVIDRAIKGVKADYEEGTPKYRGSMEGLNICRDKQPSELHTAWVLAGQGVADRMRRVPHEDEDEIRFWQCYRAEVEWVCNVMSAMLMNEGRPTIIPPTARGVMVAAEILGIGSTITEADFV